MNGKVIGWTLVLAGLTSCVSGRVVGLASPSPRLGEGDREAAAAAGLSVERDVRVIDADDFLHDGEAESGTVREASARQKRSKTWGLSSAESPMPWSSTVSALAFTVTITSGDWL